MPMVSRLLFIAALVLVVCVRKNQALGRLSAGYKRIIKCKSSLQAEIGSASEGGSGSGNGGASSRLLLTGRSLVECSGIGNASGGMVNPMKWDPVSNTFQLQDDQSYNSAKRLKKRKIFSQMLWASFMPSGELTPDYYRYTLWRLAQRFVGASSSVFGTQALVLALGFKLNTIGIAAATTWVMKDALGKFSRIFWASKHGRKFDFNAKKWRFRSAILFATGNGFEILTYVFPSFFLVSAALANALKQMAMLTSSATRNAIYKSFSRKSDNIGDITAKGEAQIAVVDLLGMFVGIMLSRAISGDRVKMCIAFIVMSIMDIYCIHKEIRSVIFNSLNFERTGLILRSVFSGSGYVVTPMEVAEKEELLLPYTVSEHIFATWSSLSKEVSGQLLQSCFDIFGPDEKFCIVLHYDRKDRLVPQVLLRRDATSMDIFRSLVVTHRVLYTYETNHDSHFAAEAVGGASALNELRQSQLLSLVTEAKAYETNNSQELLKSMNRAGWDVSTFMYGAVGQRVEW